MPVRCDCLSSYVARTVWFHTKGSHTVDVNRILSELREERANLIDAIANLERLAGGRGKRRGRPLKWLAEAREQRKRGPGRRKRRAAA